MCIATCVCVSECRNVRNMLQTGCESHIPLLKELPLPTMFWKVSVMEFVPQPFCNMCVCVCVCFESCRNGAKCVANYTTFVTKSIPNVGISQGFCRSFAHEVAICNISVCLPLCVECRNGAKFFAKIWFPFVTEPITNRGFFRRFLCWNLHMQWFATCACECRSLLKTSQTYTPS